MLFRSPAAFSQIKAARSEFLDDGLKGNVKSSVDDHGLHNEMMAEEK